MPAYRARYDIMVLSCFVNTLSPLWNILHNNTNQSRFLHLYTRKVHLPHIYHYNQYPIYPSGSIGTLPLVRFIWTCAEYTESSYDKHTITTEIRSDYYIYTLERSICLIINIMINIQYISRCVIQISNSVRFTRHAVSLDYRYSSVSFKRPLQSVLLTDTRARWHCERLPLIIHVLSWLHQSDTSQSNTQSRTNIT